MALLLFPMAFAVVPVGVKAVSQEVDLGCVPQFIAENIDTVHILKHSTADRER